jgi:hypothetical protein
MALASLLITAVTHFEFQLRQSQTEARRCAQKTQSLPIAIISGFAVKMLYKILLNIVNFCLKVNFCNSLIMKKRGKGERLSF